jgi:hypothetical protein
MDVGNDVVDVPIMYHGGANTKVFKNFYNKVERKYSADGCSKTVERRKQSRRIRVMTE